MRPVRTFLIGLATSLGVGFAAGASLFQYATARLDELRAELPRLDAPGAYRPPSKTRLVAADGTLLTEVYRENREWVPLEAVPRALVEATITSEDRRFREHIGISPRDIVRAALTNAQAGRPAQGGSTITQQLARDIYLSPRKQLRRKLVEALLAIELERRYAKDEILELYLNEINYGKGLYGVRTAARSYFGKAPGELTLAECAALAQIPQRPTANNLWADPAGALRRRNLILTNMAELGYLSAEQRDRALAEPLRVRPWQPADCAPRRAPYYTSWALRELLAMLGEERVYAGGLTVTCYLDLPLQATADRAVGQAVSRATAGGARQGAAVLLDHRTGAVLALVGGTSWAASQFNRATQAQRQPGSTFKIFVYTAALDRGYRPTDRVLDAPLEMRDGQKIWRPKNYDLKWHGNVTIQQAVAHSINIPAIKIAQRLGPTTVINYARRMGLRSPLRPVPSLALGVGEVNLLELVSAVGVLPAGGQRVEPTTIARIEDASGRVLYEHHPAPSAVLPPETAYGMVQLLREVMVSGTGRPAAMDVPCGGKTGTTQELRDAWFVGFTPRYTAGVWLGRDDNGRMRGIFGGTHCGPAWRTILQAVIARDGGAGAFTPPTVSRPGQPPEIEITGGSARRTLTICADSDMLANPHCPRPVQREYEPGHEPQQTCVLHTAPAPPEPEPTQPAPTVPRPPPAGLSIDDELPGDPALPTEPPVAKPAPELTAVPLARQFVICPDSGRLATERCPRRVTREYAPDQAPTQECNVH